MSHSPGPWYWDNDDENYDCSHLCDVRDYAILRPVLESIHGGIGPAYLHLRFIDDTGADKKLIAAAPDLLRTCKTVARYLDRVLAPGPDPFASKLRDNYLRQLRQAIDKAAPPQPTTTEEESIPKIFPDSC